MSGGMGTLEGYCFHHVQAIMLAIDQYAETALGNREYFLNKPHSIGGKNDCAKQDRDGFHRPTQRQNIWGSSYPLVLRESWLPVRSRDAMQMQRRGCRRWAGRTGGLRT
jgi:hypothetical protein